MDSLKAVKILPFAFAVHNFEEAWTICDKGFMHYNPLVVNAMQFIVAVSLFTILGFILVFGKKFYKSAKHYQYAVTGFSGMLFLNVFFPHVFSAIYLQNYTPGLISASTIIFPLSGSILWRIFKSKIFTNMQFAKIIFFSGIAGIVLVAVFLGIGYFFSV